MLLALPVSWPVSQRAWAQRPKCEKLPSISLRTPDNKPVPLDRLRGKAEAIVLVYGKAGQLRTKRTIDDLAKLVAKYHDRAVVVVVAATARHGGYKAARELRSGLPKGFTVLVDQGDALRVACGFFVYPTTAVFDKNHTLRAAYAGHREDYHMTLEGVFREVFGMPKIDLRPPKRLPASKQGRLSHLQQMMRKRDLARAEMRLRKTQSLLSPAALPLILKKYRHWASLLPASDNEAITGAAAVLPGGKKRQLARAIARLRVVIQKKGADAPLAHLWLGRALARRGDGDGARAAWLRCAGKPNLRGQCEFELMGLLRSSQVPRAMKWCERAFARLVGPPSKGAIYADMAPGPKMAPTPVAKTTTPERAAKAATSPAAAAGAAEPATAEPKKLTAAERRAKLRAERKAARAQRKAARAQRKAARKAARLAARKAAAERRAIRRAERKAARKARAERKAARRAERKAARAARRAERKAARAARRAAPGRKAAGEVADDKKTPGPKSSRPATRP